MRESLLEGLCTRRSNVVAGIQDRRTTYIDHDSMILGFLRDKSWKMLPGLSYDADNACIRCGVCARICPVGNISITDDGAAVASAALPVSTGVRNERLT